MSDTVPPHYQGLWRRTLLTAPGLRDDTTLVLWLQTAQWHADLRIPADRPPCKGRTSLHDCSRDELLGLLRQEGFAGITQVQGDTCEWLRQLDYRPTGRRDLGSMAFSPACDAIDEVGIEADYAERWEREPQGSGTQAMVHVPDERAPVLWLASGSCFMRVRPRAMRAEEVRAAWTRVQNGSAHDEELRQLADFEISFGDIAHGQGQIIHSTLPWLEGARLKPSCPAVSG
uniref:Uncharacterized protein n=1 Tax=mine drainage metagenome TaxID=410659 RepID=E6PK33_9ZZZZ